MWNHFFFLLSYGIRLRTNVIKFSKLSNRYPSSFAYYSFIATILPPLLLYLFWFHATHTHREWDLERCWNNIRQTLSLYVINANAFVEFQEALNALFHFFFLQVETRHAIVINTEIVFMQNPWHMDSKIIHWM